MKPPATTIEQLLRITAPELVVSDPPTEIRPLLRIVPLGTRSAATVMVPELSNTVPLSVLRPD